MAKNLHTKYVGSFGINDQIQEAFWRKKRRLIESRDNKRQRKKMKQVKKNIFFNARKKPKIGKKANETIVYKI